jgi:hypothetical protein
MGVVVAEDRVVAVAEPEAGGGLPPGGEPVDVTGGRAIFDRCECLSVGVT